MIKILEAITFSQFISKHGQIRIPQLQRDYAQGRKGLKETEIRHGFLVALRDALERPVNEDFAPLNLDFVYGCDVSMPDEHFSPLDGQQRLTTLFLLHWLLAWRDGEMADFTARFCEGIHARFSYKVRTSSSEFFDSLVANPPLEPAAELPNLKSWITNQPWYFRYWRLDPTVQGVLEMLQAMHERFAGRKPGELYARLIDELHPAITFQLLDLGEFPLSDDLYIKMNARGKPLTTFETFKARYEQKLHDHFPPEARREIGGAAFPLKEFVARRMDTAWTDFFWAYQLERNQLDPQRLDEAFMNVFRMVALVSRDPEKKTYRADIELLRDSANPPMYSTFKARGWLDPAFSCLLVSLMETWCAAGSRLLPDGPYEEQAIFRQLLDNPAKLSVTQVLLFTGYALYIQKHEADLKKAQFAEWMRVVHNLGVNSDIDRNDRLLNPTKTLRDLLPHSLAILPRIQTLGRHERATGFYEQQQLEEAMKSGLLLTDPAGWRPLIEQAERHGYFRGQIDFLLGFSGVNAECERTPIGDWNSATHLRLQQSFQGYLEKAEAMFNAGGLIDLGEARWQRALLSIGDYLLLRGNTNFSFLENSSTEPFSWKRLLRGGAPGSSEACRRPFLQQLWDHPDYGQPLSVHLDAIIAAASGLEPWREALVKSAAAVAYCCTIQVDDDYANQVYLLSTTQRKGWHAELFTFVLQHQLREASARQSFAPFSIGDYHYSRLKDEPPYLPLHFLWGGAQFTIIIHGRDGNFKLWIELPPLYDLLPRFTEAGFVESSKESNWRVCTVAPSDIETVLRDLVSLFTTP